MKNFTWTIFLAICFVFPQVRCHADHSVLLLVSFGGFRWDYLEKVKQANLNTPNFDSLIRGGVTVGETGITNVFPTDSWPNQYSMVTGLFSENHGVVSDCMFDPTLNLTNLADYSNPIWFNNGKTGVGELYHGPIPIWNLNQKFGSGISQKRSGTSSWLHGTEAPIGGEHPVHYTHYNSSTPDKVRIDTILNWFATENEPINLGMTYFEEPGTTGQQNGPDTDKIIKKVIELDSLVGYLIEELKVRHLFDKMNIILTSDHGMTNINDTIVLGDYLDASLYQLHGISPVLNILPIKDKMEYVFEALKKVPHMKVYHKKDIPAAYHFTHNERIMPIVVEAEPGYQICQTADMCKHWLGGHGYNNSLPEMHPFFVAHGPAFKKGFVAKPFNIVDIMPLMCHILDIQAPDGIDGSLERVEQLLYVDERVHLFTSVTVLTSIILAMMLSLIYVVAVCRVFQRMHVRILHRKNTSLVLSHVNSEGARPLLDADEFD